VCVCVCVINNIIVIHRVNEFFRGNLQLKGHTDVRETEGGIERSNEPGVRKARKGRDRK